MIYDIIPTTPAGQFGFDFSTPAPVLQPVTDERSPRERRLDDARDTLARGFSEVRDDPAALTAYLAFTARFRDYSARNRLLIYMQRPRAQFCKGYKAWLSEGRQVRKGERGLTILAPMLRRPTGEEIAAGADPERRVPYGFRAAVTFDYEQTDPVGENPLVYTPPMTRLATDGPDGLASRLESAARAIGYTVKTKPTGYADGRCRFTDKTIEVRAGLSPADAASVLAHEIAHALAHGPESRGETTKAQMELQAEGAAYVALSALGLDTARATLPYLKNWADSDDDALSSELAAIDRIASRLLALVDEAASEMESTEVDSPESVTTPS